MTPVLLSQAVHCEGVRLRECMSACSDSYAESGESRKEDARQSMKHSHCRASQHVSAPSYDTDEQC